MIHIQVDTYNEYADEALYKVNHEHLLSHSIVQRIHVIVKYVRNCLKWYLGNLYTQTDTDFTIQYKTLYSTKSIQFPRKLFFNERKIESTRKKKCIN